MTGSSIKNTSAAYLIVLILCAAVSGCQLFAPKEELGSFSADAYDTYIYLRWENPDTDIYDKFKVYYRKLPQNDEDTEFILHEGTISGISSGNYRLGTYLYGLEPETEYEIKIVPVSVRHLYGPPLINTAATKAEDDLNDTQDPAADSLRVTAVQTSRTSLSFEWMMGENFSCSYFELQLTEKDSAEILRTRMISFIPYTTKTTGNTYSYYSYPYSYNNTASVETVPAVYKQKFTGLDPDTIYTLHITAYDDDRNIVKEFSLQPIKTVDKLQRETYESVKYAAPLYAGGSFSSIAAAAGGAAIAGGNVPECYEQVDDISGYQGNGAEKETVYFFRKDDGYYYPASYITHLDDVQEVFFFGGVFAAVWSDNAAGETVIRFYDASQMDDPELAARYSLAASYTPVDWHTDDESISVLLEDQDGKWSVRRYAVNSAGNDITESTAAVTFGESDEIFSNIAEVSADRILISAGSAVYAGSKSTSGEFDTHTVLHDFGDEELISDLKSINGTLCVLHDDEVSLLDPDSGITQRNIVLDPDVVFSEQDDFAGGVQGDYLIVQRKSGYLYDSYFVRLKDGSVHRTGEYAAAYDGSSYLSHARYYGISVNSCDTGKQLQHFGYSNLSYIGVGMENFTRGNRLYSFYQPESGNADITIIKTDTPLPVITYAGKLPFKIKSYISRRNDYWYALADKDGYYQLNVFQFDAETQQTEILYTKTFSVEISSKWLTVPVDFIQFNQSGTLFSVRLDETLYFFSNGSAGIQYIDSFTAPGTLSGTALYDNFCIASTNDELLYVSLKGNTSQLAAMQPVSSAYTSCILPDEETLYAFYRNEGNLYLDIYSAAEDKLEKIHDISYFIMKAAEEDRAVKRGELLEILDDVLFIDTASETAAVSIADPGKPLTESVVQYGDRLFMVFAEYSDWRCTNCSTNTLIKNNHNSCCQQ